MNFTDIIGNDSIKERLKTAIENNSISNTLLFSGPEAVGKSLFATALACNLMHPENDIDPIALKKIQANNHPDLHIYEPEGKTSHHSIASIRNLIEQVYMSPFEAQAKVFIIKDAHRMLIPSANALLKTLEEPTLDSFIILISSNTEEILPTITSRCFRFNFSAIREEEIIDLLQKKYSLPQTQACQIARISNGSIGRAVELARHPDYLKKREVFISILAKENISSFFDLSEALAKLDDEYTQSFSKDNQTKYVNEVDLLLEKLLYWFRDLHLLKIKANEKYLFFHDKVDLLKKQEVKNLVPLHRLNSLVEEIKFALSRNIKLKYALENFFIKINFI